MAQVFPYHYGEVVRQSVFGMLHIDDYGIYKLLAALLLISLVYTGRVITVCYYLFGRRSSSHRFRGLANDNDQEVDAANLPATAAHGAAEAAPAAQPAVHMARGAPLVTLQVFTTPQGTKVHLDGSCAALSQSTARIPRDLTVLQQVYGRSPGPSVG